MKTYMVEITTHAVVVADDETHACAVAERYKHDALRDDVNPLVEVECEVTRLEDLKHGWDGDCIPYGGDGNTRLSVILAANTNDARQAGLEELVERMRQAPDRLWMADLVGQKISVERMRDILAFALAQQPSAAPVDGQLPAAPWLGHDLERGDMHGFSHDEVRANVAHATALLQAEIEALRVEVERLQEIVRPKREEECLTLDHWRMRAYDLEANWSRCSQACADEHTKRIEAEARAERLAEACAHCVDGIVPMTLDRPCAYCHGIGTAAQPGGSGNDR